MTEDASGGWRPVPGCKCGQCPPAPSRERVDPDLLAAAMDEAFTVEDQESFVDDAEWWRGFAPRVLAILARQPDEHGEAEGKITNWPTPGDNEHPAAVGEEREADAPCSFKGTWGECRKWRADPVHVQPNERKQRDQHVWRNDRRATLRPR